MSPMPSPLVASVLLIAMGMTAATPCFSAEPEIVPERLLVLGGVTANGRAVVLTDPVQALLVSGRWGPPRAGDPVTLPDNSQKSWREITATEPGTFENDALRGGYAFWRVPSDAPRVMILEASGHSRVFVNGAPRPGDVYEYGYVRLPVALKRGDNDFLFQAGRGRLKVRLVTPDTPVSLDTRDTTLPDLRVGEAANTEGALVVINATEKPLTGLAIEAATGTAAPARRPVPRIEAMSVRKIAFPVEAPAPSAAGSVPVALHLRDARGQELSSTTLELRIRRPEETYKRTFTSDIDGSLQYFAVNPARPKAPQPAPGPNRYTDPPANPPALILSLHGASVEAINQADAYGPKSWATLVAPTNRRPYGYDWEDWGRLDALEVLRLAEDLFHPDPARIYLTGHSMGGHGTWSVGAIHPDLFAAIAPSAGWISAYTYTRGAVRYENPKPVEDILERANILGDTPALAPNYAAYGIYILHGSADDNVPPTESRSMVETLKGFHHDFVYHEEPGQGHWWDLNTEEPGADCVDWAPLMDFLSRHALPPLQSVRTVDFVTGNPGASAWFRWAGVEEQEHMMRLSRVHLVCDPSSRRFSGTTENVVRLALDLAPLMPGKGLRVDLDGQALTLPDAPAGGIVHLRRADGRWAFAGAPLPSEKNPNRYGPFKAAFNHRMLFVYGTKGNALENRWAFDTARNDAETFWYRGNGSVDVVPDTAFDPKAEPDRGVVLYGNAETNGAWAALLSGSPVQVRRGAVRVGEHAFQGDDLAALFVRPRPGSDVACVAAVAPSGPAGGRLAHNLPYLQPMIGFPDVLVVGSDALMRGTGGIRCAGFFGADWGVPTGDIAFSAMDRPNPSGGTR